MEAGRNAGLAVTRRRRRVDRLSRAGKTALPTVCGHETCGPELGAEVLDGDNMRQHLGQGMAPLQPNDLGERRLTRSSPRPK